MAHIDMPIPSKITLDSVKTVKFRVKEARFGDGYIQVAPDGLNDRVDTWVIQWAGLSQAQMTTVTSALNYVGASGYLVWTPCYENNVKKFRMTTDGYTRTRSRGVFSMSCTVEEVFIL
jgi:phage-related protein